MIRSIGMHLAKGVLGLTGLLLFGCVTAHSGLPRAARDRPDEISGPQIHLMYILPRDGADEGLDTNGDILRSVAASQKWLTSQTGGRSLRIDTYQGAPDITFFRLPHTLAEIRSAGDRARDRIEEDLHAAGFHAANKIYATYYNGITDAHCASAPHPPNLKGDVVTLFLKGLPKDPKPCATNPFASNEDKPGYWEFSMLHEIFHALGAVADCAPHFTRESHVGDDRHDLLYAGDEPWDPSILDLGRDDYFGHGRNDCLDISRSLFLTKGR
ncbi:MAG TPA: hypothetical protein VIA62_11395 [Thermoanaerobaculia bacterium]|nr:hypothetical protein [Thermoanaerobaculia bacterium]